MSAGQRYFRRPESFKTHQCLPERQKPVQDQHRAVQCERYQRWCKSVGGLESTRDRVYIYLLPYSAAVIMINRNRHSYACEYIVMYVSWLVEQYETNVMVTVGIVKETKAQLHS